MRLADGTTTRAAHPAWDDALYERVEAAVLAGEDEVVLFGQMPKDGPAYALRRVLDEHPEVFWLAGDFALAEEPGRRTLRLKRLYPERDAARMQAELDARGGEVVEFAAAGTNDAERVELVYEWLCTRMRYRESRRAWEDQTAYAALCLREAVCAGISRAFVLCLRRLGLRAGIVVGGADTRALDRHAWNVVELTGHRLHVDVTQGVSLYARAGVVGHPLYLVPEAEALALRHVREGQLEGAVQPVGGEALAPVSPVEVCPSKKALRAALYRSCAGLRTPGEGRMALTLRMGAGVFATQGEFEACVRQLVARVRQGGHAGAGFRGYATYPGQTLVLWG